MRFDNSDMPLPLAYLLFLTFQVPAWLCGGLLWAGFMIALVGSDPLDALVGGLSWGFFMWVVVGNFITLGLVWRRSAEFPAPDPAVFRTALERACRKLRLIVLADSEGAMVLGPKWALVRTRLQKVRIEFVGSTAVLTAPALSIGPIRKAVSRAQAEATAGEQQAFHGQRHAEPGAAAERPRE